MDEIRLLKFLAGVVIGAPIGIVAAHLVLWWQDRRRERKEAAEWRVISAESLVRLARDRAHDRVRREFEEMRDRAAEAGERERERLHREMGS